MAAVLRISRSGRFSLAASWRRPTGCSAAIRSRIRARRVISSIRSGASFRIRVIKPESIRSPPSDLVGQFPPARVNYVPKEILTQKLTLYKQKRGVFERFLVKKRFKPILDTGDCPRCPKKEKFRNLNRRCSCLERTRRSFRLTHSPRFRLWRMPHWGTSRFVPPVSIFQTRIISTPSRARWISASLSRRLSPSRILSILGWVAGWRGVNTVQQSS